MLKLRLMLIISMHLIGLVVFFVVAKPVHSRGEDDRHSIVSHFLNRHASVVDVDFGTALANMLFVLLPVASTFLIIDLYALRKPPVEHFGCFACFLLAIALNVIASIGIWLTFGGWGPPVISQVIIAILVAMLIPAAISEWRIFRSETI